MHSLIRDSPPGRHRKYYTQRPQPGSVGRVSAVLHDPRWMGLGLLLSKVGPLLGVFALFGLMAGADAPTGWGTASFRVQ